MTPRYLYLVREIDYEWWEVAGTYETFDEARAAGEQRPQRDWDILRLEVGSAGESEVVYTPPIPIPAGGVPRRVPFMGSVCA